MSAIYPIAVPKWGIEMVEGTIATWNKDLGDAVAKGDDVFEMESDKIVNVWKSPVDGVLRRRLADEGDTIAVGGLLGIIAAADIGDAEIDEFIAGFSVEGDQVAAQKTVTAEPETTPAPVHRPTTTTSDGPRRVNPVVRRLAAELNVDLDTVVGSGRNGRITKEDVVRTAAEPTSTDNTSSSAVADGVEIIPLSPLRKTIGKRLTQAKQEIPHFYLTAEYELDGLFRRRKTLKNAGDKVSVNDMLVWCVAQALLKEPRVNVNLIGDNIHQFKHANVSVAISTDDGLFPATIYKADTLSPQEISAATAELAAKATSGTLTKEDISNGSFTVSNLGMFGVSTFNAIVNPPMGAILALGRAQQRVVVKNGEPTVATIINASLSCDHRVIDGTVGAAFLAVLGEEINALE